MTSTTTETLHKAELTINAPTRDRQESRANNNQASHLAGMLWFSGWLFSIGYCHLIWWKALLGLLVWPYFLGSIMAS